MSHHRVALLTIAGAVLLDAACGVLYAAAERIPAARGLYCAVGNAVTEGACTAPVTTAGRWVDLIEFLLVVPLFAATFSLFTSGLTAGHVRRSEARIKDHFTTTHGGEGDPGG
ncbi:MAG: hypothetical protein M3Y33_03845 [Actinomycetota bacterium]|nr:hypothetical protein [Actinomycetota bacterium]